MSGNILDQALNFTMNQAYYAAGMVKGHDIARNSRTGRARTRPATTPRPRPQQSPQPRPTAVPRESSSLSQEAMCNCSRAGGFSAQDMWALQSLLQEIYEEVSDLQTPQPFQNGNPGNFQQFQNANRQILLRLL